jgi:hypothetical protein
MVEHIKSWWDKYSQVTAVFLQLLLVLLALFIHGIYVARSIGGIESIVSISSHRLDTLESEYSRLPENFVTRREHDDLKQRLDSQKEDITIKDREVKELICSSNSEIKGMLKAYSDKLDKFHEMLLEKRR